jgi:hypothetical protein
LQTAGTAVPSYVSELLENKEITPEMEYNIKWSAASFYSGGADTVRIISSRFSPFSLKWCFVIQTVSVVHSFFLAMLLHPEVQRKAQEEVDRVIGNDRFPTLADQPNLPYVEAVVKEVLRWGPVAPLCKFNLFRIG